MNLTLLLIIIFILLLINYLIFLTGIKTGLKRIKYERTIGKTIKANAPGVSLKASVIIPFRNESGNILNSLDCVERQNYPKELFEVIYVNDSSTDDSFEKLSNARKSCNIKIISNEENNFPAGFKKIALRKGIEASKGEIIVTTDADTLFGERWLKSLLENFNEDTGLVAGPVNFSAAGGLFAAFQALEFSGLVLTGAGLIGINKPVICNGANLAYRRKVYNEVNGFKNHLKLSSGEDGLLMLSVAEKGFWKIKFSWNEDSLATTSPEETFKEFFQQRKRWASKSLYYPGKLLRLNLILIFLFYLGIPAQFILTFVLSKIFLLSLVISLSAKCFLEYFIIKDGEDFLFPGKILRHFITSELIQIPYIIISAAAGLTGRFEWKGRKLKR